MIVTSTMGDLKRTTSSSRSSMTSATTTPAALLRDAMNILSEDEDIMCRITVHQVLQFITIAITFRNEIQKQASNNVDEMPPSSLSPEMAELLGNSTNIDEHDIPQCWKAFRELVWAHANTAGGISLSLPPSIDCREPQNLYVSEGYPYLITFNDHKWPHYACQTDAFAATAWATEYHIGTRLYFNDDGRLRELCSVEDMLLNGDAAPKWKRSFEFGAILPNSAIAVTNSFFPTYMLPRFDNGKGMIRVFYFDELGVLREVRILVTVLWRHCSDFLLVHGQWVYQLSDNTWQRSALEIRGADTHRIAAFSWVENGVAKWSLIWAEKEPTPGEGGLLWETTQSGNSISNWNHVYCAPRQVGNTRYKEPCDNMRGLAAFCNPRGAWFVLIQYMDNLLQ